MHPSPFIHSRTHTHTHTHQHVSQKQKQQGGQEGKTTKKRQSSQRLFTVVLFFSPSFNSGIYSMHWQWSGNKMCRKTTTRTSKGGRKHLFFKSKTRKGSCSTTRRRERERQIEGERQKKRTSCISYTRPLPFYRCFSYRVLSPTYAVRGRLKSSTCGSGL
jgi:hypothetical protein